MPFDSGFQVFFLKQKLIINGNKEKSNTINDAK